MKSVDQFMYSSSASTTGKNDGIMFTGIDSIPYDVSEIRSMYTEKEWK